MRIYTKHVWQWQPDGTLKSVPEESESFEYEGPIAHCGKDSSPPPSPDYTGAAQATATGNLQAAQQAQQANMVNQYTPYGSLTYTQAPTSFTNSDGTTNPQYQSNISLSPTGTSLLNTANTTQLGLGSLQQGAEQNVANTMSQPFSMGGVNDIANQSYADYTARLDPQWQQNTEMENSKLANEGITPGSDAYNNDMRTFNQAKNDAYTQANQASIQTMPQTYGLASAAYNQPLNELNALMTGSQVTNPTFGSSPQQQTTTGPNYLGATQSTGQYNQGIYNAQVGQQNSNTGAEAGLASAAMMAAMFMSDERLKKDIHKVGEHPLGFGIHTFRYKWDKPYESPRIGVMAQEVEKVIPEAVFSFGGKDNIRAVDYAQL